MSDWNRGRRGRLLLGGGERVFWVTEESDLSEKKDFLYAARRLEAMSANDHAQKGPGTVKIREKGNSN